MSQYDNRGQVSLWNARQISDKSPSLTGSVIAHRDIKEGEVLDIALWSNESQNPKAPAFKGKVQDKRQPTDYAQEASQKQKDYISSAQGVSEPDDSEVPF